MKSSCITHPEREPLLVIRRSQIDFCGGNHCAASLMSFFEDWHNIKLDIQPKNIKLNDVADFHGEEAVHDTSLFQFHSMDELSEGLLGLYGISKIKESREKLVKLGIVTEHKNPSDRYKFDRTIYYLFHPEIYNKWLNRRVVENKAK